jgi:hypothetical protein
LNKILEDACWVRKAPLGAVTTSDGQAAISVAGSGIRIQLAPSKQGELQPKAEAFADALRQEGIAAGAFANPELENNANVINIVSSTKN